MEQNTEWYSSTVYDDSDVGIPTDLNFSAGQIWGNSKVKGFYNYHDNLTVQGSDQGNSPRQGLFLKDWSAYSLLQENWKKASLKNRGQILTAEPLALYLLWVCAVPLTKRELIYWMLFSLQASQMTFMRGHQLSSRWVHWGRRARLPHAHGVQTWRSLWLGTVGTVPKLRQGVAGIQCSRSLSSTYSP